MTTKSGIADADSVTLSGNGNKFKLSQNTYTASQQFVFSATANFKSDSSVAAGLVFGADEDGDEYWVFNVDRRDNRTKLIYFYRDGGMIKDTVFEEEYYVGTNAMNDGEKAYVKSRTSKLDKVYLKVMVDSQGYAKFYADGIQRFAFTSGSEEARKINIKTPRTVEGESVVYHGGYVGYNCYEADVEFTDVQLGATDSAYYTEFYRNQYHFSQYAHWNNDPNGLVYYEGYYHLYFQHNPYGLTWDDMHWGHARSKDLVHWEQLPIALVPDYDLSDSETEQNKGSRQGCMWSGSVRVYHKGDSSVIDSRDWWYSNKREDAADGEAIGLIGWYSWWNGNGGNKYTITMFSDDGGLSWHKSDNIPRETSKDPEGATATDGSWRDPKVFKLSDHGINDGTYKWGMALTNMEGRQHWGDCDGVLYFLKSADLIHWEHAGSYRCYIPECPDVVRLTADDSSSHTLITFTSRYYTVCDLVLEEGNLVMYDAATNQKIENLGRYSDSLHKMDYGVDSYACQTFYIDDSSSAYNGQAVSVAWLSGVPNAPESIESGALRSATKVWNGGGFTIPVVYGLKKIGTSYVLSTTPIVKDDGNFDKTAIADVAHIASHNIEIAATVSGADFNVDKSYYIRVNQSIDGSHYTEIGWNKTDGYYVDRSKTEDAGIAFPSPNYALKYASGKGRDNASLDFYILVDNNCVEVYCDGFTVPMYVITFASPYSVYASASSSQRAGEGSFTATTINRIGTVWRDTATVEPSIILSADDITIGTEIVNSKEILAYADGRTLSWSIVEGEGVVTVTPTYRGALISGVTAGTAKVRVVCSGVEKFINVTVRSGSLEGPSFSGDGVIAGNWYYDGDVLVGENLSGDGYLLSDRTGGDFSYETVFDLGSGTAAALILRAEVNSEGTGLAKYIIVNYDKVEGVVKAWSNVHLIANVPAVCADLHNVKLGVIAIGRSLKVYLNDALVLDSVLDQNDPVSGRIGLNVFSTAASFKSLKFAVFSGDTATYSGSGSLTVTMPSEQGVKNVTNLTLGGLLVDPAYYSVSGDKLTIISDYFALLPAAGDYELDVDGTSGIPYSVIVTVEAVPSSGLTPVTVGEGANAVIYTGNVTVEYVKLNGTILASSQYTVKNGAIVIAAELLKVGENTVEIANGKSTTVTVTAAPKDVVDTVEEIVKGEDANVGLIVGLSVGGAVLAAGVAVAVFFIIKKKRPY